MKTNDQTREARSNPEVREKIQRLQKDWESLSNAQRQESIQNLKALRCTNTDLARSLNLTESAIRYYTVKSGRVSKSKLPESERVRPESAPVDYKDEILQSMIDYLESKNSFDPPPPISRNDQIRECSIVFLNKFAGSGGPRAQFLELVRRRCEQYEFCGPLPKPVPEDVVPAAVFAEFNAAELEIEPMCAVEFLAVSLLRLVPDGYQRDQLLRKLETS